ncbi:FAD-binding oxidoreductase [Aliishimia ponticola]|uniref:FAD-binding oxidoreductase n=1 Tax=Aliishimia ponticola TaxID=2499833 RepID=A0A4S4NFH8_9RHOB|nr:FAD-binding oxidoreductase [Aliishimia ponticola]THH36881.1 FAD-binding oxidoreductase [Aliishimia ponticola]
MTEHVIVIGAGIVGASTAIWLRRFGHEVTVIDRMGWGQGTSHGNGGVLAACAMVPVTGPGLVRKSPAMLLDPNYPLFLRWSYLPKLAPWLVKYLSHANDADTRRIADGLAPVVTDTADQHVALAKGTRAERFVTLSDYSYAYADRAAFDADRYAWDIRAVHGFVPRITEGAAVHEAEPDLGPDITCLATMSDHGYVSDPGGYVAALGKEFAALGGTFVKAEVKDLTLTDGKVTSVETSAGRFDANRVVLATGVWSKPLMRKLGLNVPLESERGYHIIFANAERGPRHPIMVASGKFVATPMAAGLRCAGVVEFGGLDAGASKAPFDFLRKQARKAFPYLNCTGEIEWQGHRPAPSDSLPLLGQVGDSGVYTGFGHHHIGLTAGPKSGRLIAQMISGQPPNMDLTPYHPARFA